MVDFIEIKTLESLESLESIPRLNNLFSDSFVKYTETLRTYRRLLSKTRKNVIQMKVKSLLANAKFTIACDKEDDQVIYGFLVFTDDPKNFYMHFAYVKKEFRGIGICKQMLDASMNPHKLKMYTIPTNKFLKYSIFKDFKLSKGLL